MRRDLHEANRLSWNAATRAHESHKAHQAEFLRAGGTTLFPEELALLGDVRGRDVLHLQCNAGPDSLSIAALGANVTGVDISDQAIDAARALAAATGLAGEFVCADVYDYLAQGAAGPRRFDVVFASYGALCWLSDIAVWAHGVAGLLAPGGRLVVMEFHPVAGMYSASWQRDHGYFCGGVPTHWPGVHDYVAASGDGLLPFAASPGVDAFENPHDCHVFEWAIGEILGAVLAAGLRLDHFAEYPYANGCKLFEPMEQRGRRFHAPPGTPALPLMYSLVASRA